MSGKCLGYNNQVGAALIEFAIIVPLLLLLVIGISEFGWAFYHQNTLNKSVQDGARFFSDPLRARKGVSSDVIDVNPATNGANIMATQNLIIYGNTAVVGDSLLTNSGNYSTPIVPIIVGANLDHIEVTATYNHNLITGDLLSGLINIISGGNISVGPAIPLTASTVLRVEGG